MKSFSQFLQESYLNEAGVPDDYEEYMRKYSGTPKKLAQMSDADFNARFGNNPKMNVARDIGQQQGRLLNRKNQAYKDINNPNPGNRGYATDPTPTPASRRLSAGAPEAPKTSPGQLEIPEPKTTKVPGTSVRSAGEVRQPSLLTKSGGAQDFTNPRKVPFTSSEPVQTRSKVQATPPNKPSGGFGGQSPGQMTIPGTNVGRPGDAARNEAEIAQRKATERASAPKPPKPEATPSAPKPPSGSKFKLPAGAKKALNVGGKLIGPASAALDVADERAKGSSWLRSGLKAAVVGAGGALGGAAGSAVAPGVGSLVGATGGAMAASKAFDVAAGANARERKAIATANRKSQAGSAIKGIGGKTTFDTKKNTITTGTGAQRKTAQLGKTSVVTGPGGKQDVGYLAYKGGKAVYKKADTKSLAQTSSNPLERIGRSLFAGAYKKSDAANAAKKLAAARQSDVTRNKALGVKALPGK